LYVVGGYSFDTESWQLFVPRAAVYSYDPVADMWEKKAGLNTPRAECAVAAVGGHLYAIGGYSDYFRYLTSVERYDPVTDTWAYVADLPRPRAEASAAVQAGVILLAGGQDPMEGRPEVFVYRPVADAWVDTRGSLGDLPRARINGHLVKLPGYGLYSLAGAERMGLTWADGMEYRPLSAPRRPIILEPAAGEELASGSVTTLRWAAPAGAGRFTLRGSLDGGRTWTVIARRVRGTTLAWKVPVPPGNLADCRLRVIARDRRGNPLPGGKGDRMFGIEVVRVNQPFREYSETYPGAWDLLSWETHATLAAVARAEVSLSLDDGRTWQLLAALDGNPGVFPWTIPDDSPGSAAARIRVRLLDAAGSSLGEDGSEPFIIQGWTRRGR
jgi:hypothetical protein